jgi:hypothetical protein
VKKWIVAALMTLTAIAASTGARGTTPASAAADPVAYGSCRYECSTTGALYLTADKCQASCPGFCEEIC